MLPGNLLVTVVGHVLGEQYCCDGGDTLKPEASPHHHMDAGTSAIVTPVGSFPKWTDVYMAAGLVSDS
jgi:hypothetical protein